MSKILDIIRAYEDSEKYADFQTDLSEAYNELVKKANADDEDVNEALLRDFSDAEAEDLRILVDLMVQVSNAEILAIKGALDRALQNRYQGNREEKLDYPKEQTRLLEPCNNSDAIDKAYIELCKRANACSARLQEGRHEYKEVKNAVLALQPSEEDVSTKTKEKKMQTFHTELERIAQRSPTHELVKLLYITASILSLVGLAVMPIISYIDSGSPRFWLSDVEKLALVASNQVQNATRPNAPGNE